MKRSVLASLGALILLCAFFVNSSDAGPILNVSGTVLKADGTEAGDGLQVTVTNQTLGITNSDTTGASAGPSKFQVVLFDFTKSHSPGDTLIITVADASGKTIGRVETTLPDTIDENPNLVVDVHLSGLIVNVNPQVVDADGKSTLTITTEVVGQDGQPITDDTLTITSALGATIGPVTHTGNGVYTATYTAPLTDQTSDTISVQSAKLGTESTVSVQLKPVPTLIDVMISPASLTADGISTATITVTIKKADVPITDEQVSVSQTGLKGSVGPFTNNGDGTYTATYTAGTVAGTDSITIQTTKSGAKTATILLQAGPAAKVTITATPSSVVGNGAAQSVLTITVTDAHNNPVVGEALTLQVDGAGTVGDVTDEEDGTYTALYTAPVVTQAGSEVVRVTTSNGIVGTVPIELLVEPPAENVALKVTGGVYLEDGLTPVAEGLQVVVTNLTKQTTMGLSPLQDTTRPLDGRVGYDVTFLDIAGGRFVASTGDLIQIEIFQDGNVVPLKTAMPHALTSDEVNAGVAQIDVTTTLTAQAPALKVAGRVFLDDGVAPAPAGLEVKVTNLTRPEVSDGTAITNTVNGETRYEVTFVSLTGDPIAETGDEILIEITQDGSPVQLLSAMPVTLKTGWVAAGVAPIDVTTALTASAQALKVRGQVFLDDGITPAAAGIGYTITNLTKNLSISGTTRRLNGIVGYDVTFIDVQEGRIVAETGDEILVELTKDGAPVAVLSPMPVRLTSAQVASGTAEINVTADLPAENVALQIAGDVLLEDGVTPAPAGLRVVATNVTKNLSAEGVTGATGYAVTLIDIAKGGVVASSGDRLEVRVYEGELLRGFTAVTLDTTSVARGVATGIDVRFAGQATRVTASAEPDQLVADGTSTATITIRAEDANQVPVSTEEIALTLEPEVGSLSAVTNNGDGSYTVTYTAGTQAGSVTVHVNATKGGVSTDLALTLVPGPTANVAVSVTPDTLDADGTSTAQITVSLTDANGNPVSDDTVTLNATTGTVGEVTNQGDGTYTATYTASKEPILVLITATTSGGKVGTAELTLKDEVPPVADAGPEQVVTPGEQVTLDGSGSTDNTRIVAYSWDFNIDDGVGEDADTAVATTSYALPGAYTARLTVTDAAGNQASDDVTIIVGGLLVRGIVFEADGTPLAVDDVAVVRVTHEGLGISVDAPVVGGLYKAVFTNEQAGQMAAGDVLTVSVLNAADPAQSFADPVQIQLTEENLTQGSVTQDITTQRTSQFAITGVLLDVDGNPLAGALVELNGVRAVTAEDGSYSLVLSDYATNPREGDILTVQFTYQGQVVRKQRVASLRNRGIRLDATFAPMRVGGLAVNTKRYFDIVDEAVAQLIETAGAEGVLTTTDVSLLKIIDLPQLLLGQFLPVFYPGPGERVYPELFKDMQNMDLENFGNAIVPSPLAAIAQGAFVKNAGLPVAVAGNKLNLYVVAPSTDIADVSFQLSGNQTVPGTVTQIDPGDPVVTNFEFQLEEEMALLFLPSWPGMDPTDPNPPTVFDSVILRYAAGDTPPVSSSAYASEPMIPRVIDGKRVWTASPLLEAGQRYSYFFEVRLKNPITVLGIGEIPLNTRTWILPDPRNLQIEDRGLIKRVLGAAQPVVNDIFREIAASIRTQGTFDQNALLNKFVGKLQAAVLPEIRAIITEMINTGDPKIVSRFSIPAVPDPTEGSLWVGSFNIEGVPDGAYEVIIEAFDGDGNLVDQIRGKEILLDRFAEKTRLTVAAGRDSAIYQRKDGIYVAAGHSPTATLRLTAVPKPAPGNAVLFQMLPVEPDLGEQQKQIWLPVNTVTLPLVMLRQVAPELAERFLADPSVETLQEIAAAVAGLDLQEFLDALAATDPRGIQAVLDALNNLDPATQADVNKITGLISQILADPSKLPDPSVLLTINFANIQKLFGLVELININPLRFSTDTMDALIGDFIEGEFWVRAVPFDPVLNMETSDVPSLHVRLVPPVADVARLVRASLGDQNGDGDDTDQFESGDAEGFRIFANVRQVTLTAQFVTRTEHPVTLSFEYALPSAPDAWKAIGEVSLDEDEGQTGDQVSVKWTTDFKALTAQAEQVFVRVVTRNAIEMTDAQMVTMALDKGPVPTEPEVVFFAAEILTTNPDSGGATGVVNLHAYTRTRTITPIEHLVFEYFDGTNWVEIGTTTDFTEVESANVDIIQSAVEQLLAGGKEITLEPTYNQWTLAWDTTGVPDTITKDEPAARDATLDDNPYRVRARVVAGDVVQANPPEDTVSVDNVDDVPPLTGTQITAIQILDDLGAPIGAPLVDGVYRVNGLTTVTAKPAAPVGTFAPDGLVLIVKLRDGDTAGDTVAELPLEEVTPGEAYTVSADTRLPDGLPNGDYFFQVLASDAAGNQEIPDPTLMVKVTIANIVDLNDETFDIADLAITGTGVYDLAAAPRSLTLPIDLRPIAGQAIFEAQVKNAAHAELVVSTAELADPEAPVIAEPTLMTVEGTATATGFTFNLDVSGLADGEYVLNFRFFASPPQVPANGRNVHVLVDNTPPTVAFVAPLSGTRVSPLPTLWATYADAGSGAHVINLSNAIPDGSRVDFEVAGRIEGNDPNATRVRPSEVPTDPGLSVLDDRVLYEPPEPLAPGGYTATLRVTDLAGNAAEASTQYIVERDLTPPVITLVTPQGTVMNRKPKLSVSFTDASPLKSATFALDGGAAEPADTIDRTVASYTPATDLDQGEHSVTVVLTDAFDNATEFSWSFIVEIDTEAPVITATSPHGTVRIANPQVIVSASDNSGVAPTVTLDLFDSAGASQGSATGDGTAVIEAKNLAAGSYTAKATATDAEGNTSTAEWTFIVELDTVPPVITATSPQGTVWVADPQVVASASDNSGDAPTVTLRLLDSKGVSKGSATGSGKAVIEAKNLTSGSYTAQVTARDASGNEATAEWTFFVKLDTVAPVFTAKSPIGVVRVENPDIVVSAVDDSGEQPSIEVELFSVAANGTRASKGVKNGKGSVTLSASNLTSGTYAVVASATDPAGNQAQTEWTFTVELDTVPPSINPVGPQGIVRVEKPLISVTVSDDVSGVADITIKLAKGSKNIPGKTTTDQAKTSATFTPSSALAAGVYNVSVTAKDAAGNTATAEWSFTVEFDTEPPVITIVTPADHARIRERRPTITVSYTDNLAGVDTASVKLKLTNPDGTKDVTGESTITMSQVRYTPSADLPIGVQTLELSVADNDGNQASLTWSFVVEAETGILRARNYPNPFTANTTIAFTLSRQSEVTIKIYDASMRLVKTLVDRQIMEAGPQEVKWDATLDSANADQAARGVYFCQIIMKTDSKPEQAVIKMVRRSE